MPTLTWGLGAVAPRPAEPAGPARAKGTAYTWVSSDTSATARQFVARCLAPANPDDLVPHDKRATPLAAHDTVAIECHRLTRTPLRGARGWYAYRLFSQAWAVPHLRDHSGQHFSFHNYFVLADGHLTVCNTRDRAANERTFAQIAPSLRKELQMGPATLDSLQRQLVRGYVKYY